MHQSHPIDVSGRFAGAAITDLGQYRFVAVDPQAESLDDSLWPSLAELRHAVHVLLITGRPPASIRADGAGRRRAA